MRQDEPFTPRRGGVAVAVAACPGQDVLRDRDQGPFPPRVGRTAGAIGSADDSESDGEGVPGLAAKGPAGPRRQRPIATPMTRRDSGPDRDGRETQPPASQNTSRNHRERARVRGGDGRRQLQVPERSVPETTPVRSSARPPVSLATPFLFHVLDIAAEAFVFVGHIFQTQHILHTFEQLDLLDRLG